MRSPGYRVSPAVINNKPRNRNVVTIMAKIAVGTGVVSAAVLLLVLMNLAPAAESSLPRMLSSDGKVYKDTYRSLSFRLGPGEVIDQVHRITMPPGHIAIRSLEAQVVDDYGFAVPLNETYLHHWLMKKYYMRPGNADDYRSTHILVPNEGPCPAAAGIPQWFGLGSETRKTNASIPPPYGIVTGDRDLLPTGFEEVWVLNLHAIDTRGTVDPLGCTECRCDLYNVTKDEEGNPLPEDYRGGLECCRGGQQCTVQPGHGGFKRPLYVEYTVTWVRMSLDVVPLRIYVLDVTDSRSAPDEIAQCEIEYPVPQCTQGDKECIHSKTSTTFLNGGGDVDVVYAVAHQHSGGIGATLRKDDGTLLCESLPIYGNGSGAGNEAGYIVGMTTCHPEPGTLQIKAHEKLRFESLYNSTQEHTGVMGLFYLLVATPRKHKENAHNGLIVGSITVFLMSAVIVGFAACRRRRTSYNPVPQSEL